MMENQDRSAKTRQREGTDDADRSIAVLVPCHNEASAVAQVVQEFRRNLPTALIYVYDNCSTDDTADIARGSGAIVRAEPLLGKGNVVRRMFADVEADIYVMVDGDGTYDAAAAPELIERLIRDGLDMVNCARVAAARWRLQAGPQVRQSHPDRSGRARVRRTPEGHAIRIPRNVPQVRKDLSRALDRL